MSNEANFQASTEPTDYELEHYEQLISKRPVLSPTELLRDASSRGEKAQTYDPNQLVVDVAEFLQSKGLKPDAKGRLGAATGAAAQLLLAFGILPASDVTSIDRLNAPDPDSR